MQYYTNCEVSPWTGTTIYLHNGRYVFILLTWAVALPQNLLEQKQTNKPLLCKSKSRIFKCVFHSIWNMSVIKCIDFFHFLRLFIFRLSKLLCVKCVKYYLEPNSMLVIVTPSLTHRIRSVLCSLCCRKDQIHNWCTSVQLCWL